MDMFMTCFAGEVDLDDPETYRTEFFETHKTVQQMKSWAWGEIGKSFIYMDYFHKHMDWEPQRSRVVKFAEELADEYHNHDRDEKEERRWWQKFCYRLMWETENQC